MRKPTVRSVKKPATARNADWREEAKECCANILTLAEMLEIGSEHVQAGRLHGKTVFRLGRMIFKEGKRALDLLTSNSPNAA